MLAHAFLPGPRDVPHHLDGDLHFDAEEEWVFHTPKLRNTRERNIYATAIHELGHSLGLPHNNSRESIMYPILLQDWTPDMSQLPEIDRQNIQGIYGEPKMFFVKNLASCLFVLFVGALGFVVGMVRYKRFGGVVNERFRMMNWNLERRKTEDGVERPRVEKKSRVDVKTRADEKSLGEEIEKHISRNLVPKRIVDVKRPRGLPPPIPLISKLKRDVICEFKENDFTDKNSHLDPQLNKQNHQTINQNYHQNSALTRQVQICKPMPPPKPKNKLIPMVSTLTIKYTQYQD